MYPAGTVLAKTLEALPCHNVEAMRARKTNSATTIQTEALFYVPFTRVGLIALREAANNHFTAKVFQLHIDHLDKLELKDLVRGGSCFDLVVASLDVLKRVR
jgi:hypothetical protein